MNTLIETVMALQNPTPSEYIQHHLSNLTYGYHPDNGWSFAHGAQEASEMGFMAIHVDTMAWSVGLGILLLVVPRWCEGGTCGRTDGRSQLCRVDGRVR